MVSLDKRARTATISLVKLLEKEAVKGNDLGNLTAQVILVFDYSSSMAPYFERGEVQELTERMLGLAQSGLDDDGQVQVYPFHHEALDPFTVDTANYTDVIETWRCGGSAAPPAVAKRGLFRRTAQPAQQQPRRMGGTNYAPVIHRIVKDLTSSKMLEKGNPPVLVLFQTDGGPLDRDETTAALRKYSSLPIFWQFVGLGSNTAFLDVLNTLSDTVVDNVGKTGWPSIKGVPDADFYDGIISEFFPSWLPKARQLGIVTV